MGARGHVASFGGISLGHDGVGGKWNVWILFGERGLAIEGFLLIPF
jgi:hypothetical protein